MLGIRGPRLQVGNLRYSRLEICATSQARSNRLHELVSHWSLELGHSLVIGHWSLVILSSLFLAFPAHGEDQNQPTIQSMIGGWLFSPSHSYMTESEVRLPLLHVEPLTVSYRYREMTPVFKQGSQTQLLFSRHDVEADLTLNEDLRLITVGGYHHTALEDRPGSLSAYAVGAGLGSAIHPQLPRLEWSAVAGPYLSRDRLDANWWADLHLHWRAYQFNELQMLETPFRPSLGLAADIESANDDTRFRAVYKVGPVLEVMSANGNRARFEARWFYNDGNPFLEKRYSGLLIGVGVSASLDQNTVFDARDHRPTGWLPLVWGQYDIGAGGDRTLQRTELTAEIHDGSLAGHIVTAILWYESRQEYRPGDFDNTSYSISFGAQTRLGLASLLSQGQPLVLAAEYLHRSAHALSPSPDRAPPPNVLPHDSLNLLPRVRLQTLGWDLPYRNPAIYQVRAAWLNSFDWRATIGYDFHHSRERSNPAAQLGLNWDVAAVQGFVLYARGLRSFGNETPDWLGEVGVRRRAGKLFFRYESYGLESDLARGNTAVVGLGFHL